MNNMEEKYNNFDGMPSDVPNDMPWSNTQWSNYDGGSITLDHHDNRIGPNMVLEMPDSDENSPTMDSDQFLNHPGFLGITWSRKKAEAQREADEQRKVNAAYPNTGGCSVLTNSLDRLNKSLDGLYADGDSGGKGARRVRKRQIKTREIRLSSVQASQEAACAEAQMNLQNQQALLTQIQAPTQRAAINPMMLGLGVLVIGGVIFAISRIGRSKKD